MVKRVMMLAVLSLVVLFAAQAFAAGFEVARFVVAGAIQEREPVGEAASFPATTEKVYAFLEAKNIAADTPVAFVWYFGTQEMARVEATIKQGWRWRTNSSKNLGGLAGEWTVKLLDSTGAELASAAFKVQ